MPTTNILDTFSAIQQRRSVKHYKADFAMPEADIEKLLSLTLLSPTSFNIQNWRFVIVRDREQRQKLREAAWNQPQMSDASLLVVICADLNAPFESPERYWKNAPEEVQKMMAGMIVNTYKDKPELQRDEAMRSAGIAAQTLMLAAKAMGYDSCPMVGFDPLKAADIINLPPNHVIPLMVVVGKAIQPARPRGGQLALSKVVKTDRF